MTWDISPKEPDRESIQLRQFVSPVDDNGQRRQASLRVIQGTSLRLGSRASCALFRASPLRTHKRADAHARGKFAARRDVVIALPDHAGSPQGRCPRVQPAASPGKRSPPHWQRKYLDRGGHLNALWTLRRAILTKTTGQEGEAAVR
jgi:hypothetical protein